MITSKHKGEIMETKNKGGFIRFDLNSSIETNFDAYQDALDENPELFRLLRMRYDQYLRTLSKHSKMRKMSAEEQPPEVAFKVVD